MSTAFAPGAVRPPFFLLMGLPDDARVRLEAAAIDKPPVMKIPGSLQVLPLPGERMPGPEIHFGSDRLSIQTQLPRVPCINCMADPDVHRKALGQASMFMAQMGTPCLNHPDAVLRNGRDSTAHLLAGINGLQVPRTIKVHVTSRAALWQAMEDAGVRFPVVARMAGSQAALGTARLDSTQDWEALNPLPWAGRDMYLTEHAADADAGGSYRHLRLAVVGREVLPCYRVETRNWLLRPEEIPAAVAGREKQWMDAFARDVLPGWHGPLMEVAARLELDCFSIDGSLRPDGSLLLVDVNAGGPAQQDMRRVPKLVDAVRRLLAAPASWRHQPVPAVPGSPRPAAQ
ncbi:MAG: hypothetical protein V4757_07995 [Pseudomonadota bacterium]